MSAPTPDLLDALLTQISGTPWAPGDTVPYTWSQSLAGGISPLHIVSSVTGYDADHIIAAIEPLKTDPVAQLAAAILQAIAGPGRDWQEPLVAQAHFSAPINLVANILGQDANSLLARLPKASTAVTAIETLTPHPGARRRRSTVLIGDAEERALFMEYLRELIQIKGRIKGRDVAALAAGKTGLSRFKGVTSDFYAGNDMTAKRRRSAALKQLVSDKWAEKHTTGGRTGTYYLYTGIGGAAVELKTEEPKLEEEVEEIEELEPEQEPEEERELGELESEEEEEEEPELELEEEKEEGEEGEEGEEEEGEENAPARGLRRRRRVKGEDASDPRKEIRRLIRLYKGEVIRSKKHNIVKFPDGKRFTLLKTASDRRSWLNSLADLRKVLGIRREKFHRKRRKNPDSDWRRIERKYMAEPTLENQERLENTRRRYGAPIYSHDCPDCPSDRPCCIFLGSEGGVDYYYHPQGSLRGRGTLIARYGNYGAEYLSLPAALVGRTAPLEEPYLHRAVELAREQNLIPQALPLREMGD